MHQTYSIVLITLLIAFAIYRRIRRNIGIQKLSTKRMWLRMIIFIVLSLFLLGISAAQPLSYLSDAIGAAVGFILAYFSIQSTEFEIYKNKWHYRPNVWISAVVIVLFLGRLLFRLVPVYEMMSHLPKDGAVPNSMQTQPYGSNPWTAGLLFIFVAYYIAYYGFLIRKAKDLPEAPEEVQANQ